MPRFAVNVVTFDSADRIDACLASVFQQSLTDFSVTVVDNASTDGTRERLARWEERGVRVLANPENRYYARAHNQAIRAGDGEFVLTLNPDVLLRPDYLERVAAAFAVSPRVGSVNGKLLLVAPDALRPDLLTGPPPADALLDGAGLTMRRSRRPYLRGNRQPAATACLEPAAIFGVDGAAAAYRRATLDDAAIEGEVFDEDFAIYREDVDLAWRAQLLGWDSRYAPEAVAYHVRRFHLGRDRRAIPPDLKRHSVKNGWLLLLKNEDPSSLLRALPWLLPYQLKILAGLLAVERSSLGAIPDTLRLLPRIRRKRAFTHARRRRSPAEMRRWFV
jgi:GT2 family glycosyltransferase